MDSKALLTLTLLLAPGFAASEDAVTGPNMVCVRNSSSHAHVFVAEAPNGERKVSRLAPDETLCARGGMKGATGMVSVFESHDAFEGCSRLVPVGQTEDMIRYVDFDRCFWSSNS
ncbi:hypothetical protein N5A93_14760 [Roseovarius sp. EGI FJ00037]|uniref:hypothetical protein n=1 Tax=Roseovarius TaxID=74030 RepID=UPI0022A87A30|nr:hypothetical protein [Roseovarius sp. EGI FJ00037]MCZ0813500.1 hypothetical protein [Roseovarius sp. EGI FJ00037]